MAVNLDDIKDQLSSTFKNSWERFQESTLYHQLRDRFENLTPTAQKLTIVGGALLVVLFLLSIPGGFYSSSSQYVSEFESKRNLLRDLFKVSREAQENPDMPVPPSLDVIKSQINNFFQMAQLIPEQIKGIDFVADKSEVISAAHSQGSLRVNLSKLNLRQIVDLGHQIQSLHKSVKLKDISIEANSQDPRYFDVSYKVTALNVPQEIMAPPEPEEPKTRASSRGGKTPPKSTKEDE